MIIDVFLNENVAAFKYTTMVVIEGRLLGDS